MKQFILGHLLDLSNEESFCFSLACAECGKNWLGKRIRFSKSGTIPATEGKREIYSVLYRRERERVKNDAVMKTINHFNACPICGRLVCNDCFLVCEDLDMCVSCAERLEEHGERVYLRKTADNFV